MKIGLIDVDGHNFPNLPLMKISAWHKNKGDTVEWYNPLTSGHCDKVYMSKVFSFSPDYEYFVDADEVIKGGSGYQIYVDDSGREHYRTPEPQLPYEVEHIYPDYSIYGIEDHAYGFLTRGCPRHCSFCHVGDKPTDGTISRKVADLSEFWNGQKFITLLDPNILACKEADDLLKQLAETKKYIDFSQGLDIRMINPYRASLINTIKTRTLHFAYDRIEDKDIIEPKFQMFRQISKIRNKDLVVYVLVGDRERRILESDMHRIYWLKENGYAPYIMVYNRDQLHKNHELLKLARYVNNRRIFWTLNSFEEYLTTKRKDYKKNEDND